MNNVKYLKIILFFFILAAIVLNPISVLGKSNYIAVTKLSLNQSSAQIDISEKFKLTAKIYPSNATTKKIIWKSSNTNIATVDNGNIKAKKAGKVVITAESTNGKKAKCSITVMKPVSSVLIDKSVFQIAVGNKHSLKATISPSDANKTLNWTSSNIYVATINEKGTITAKNPGKTIITVTSHNGKEDHFIFTVYQPATNLSLNISDLKLNIGASKTLIATIYPSNTSYKTLNWTSSNTNVATVNQQGEVTAKNSGTTTITVKTTNGKKASCNITVPKQKEKISSNSQDIYDVILFWGQSNMVGTCYTTKETRYNPNNATSVYNFSKISGISPDLLKQNTSYKNIIKIEQKPRTVYEYVYSSNSLVEITASKQQYGENLKYINNTTLQKEAKASVKTALSASLGVNMIPEFCREYYALTGHKVIAVFAAYGGTQIQEFLPYNDPDNKSIPSKKEKHMYEALKIKYNSAIEYLNSHNYKIGKKSYVVCQGCADVIAGTPSSEYVRLFKKVHNNLKKDLGITNGAIVETSGTAGLRTMAAINVIHSAQENLIKDYRSNKEIVLGSSYSYDRYVSTKSDYANCRTAVTYDEYGKRLSYNEALKRSKCSVDDSINSLGVQNNLIHFTSASLSQMGRTAAQNLAKVNK